MENGVEKLRLKFFQSSFEKALDKGTMENTLLLRRQT
jgi:hypothetical protein